ncbi:uncharacterized protein [Aegilops tauschii subsp. strangulata]|uniref:uncharacterized protein n=1 Tax=Aegilops tauschii subsp. strangulata TaxID=200361 RepID=UPI003CC86A6A
MIKVDAFSCYRRYVPPAGNAKEQRSLRLYDSPDILKIRMVSSSAIVTPVCSDRPSGVPFSLLHVDKHLHRGFLLVFAPSHVHISGLLLALTKPRKILSQTLFDRTKDKLPAW